ncbi:MAG: PKD domain-containing protein [Bacteroidota bacterium]|nr:PKD domain-containing protein [Bacteroidota bacterium]
MRKLYALLTGFVLTLLATQASATPDVANFTFTIDAPNRHVVFVNSSVLGNEPGVRRAFWSFGDGSSTMTPPLQGTQHQYQAPGTYTVCLKIYRYRSNLNDSVLSAHVCKTIFIETICRADFERLPLTAINNPLQATFKALPWHNAGRKPVRICWTFGDGKDTCIQYSNSFAGPYVVNYRYSNPGLYEVCVKILYQEGCDARKCKPVQIERPDTCRADFERLPLITINNPLQVVFKALPEHNNNRKPARICWNFGDGNDTCITYPENYIGLYTVGHRYEHAGQYEVCVKILYYGGCEARKCKAITIPPPPVNCRVQLFEITPSITSLVRGFWAVPYSQPVRRPERVCWYFGDGEDTCIMINPDHPLPDLLIRHTYPAPGVYRACVRILFQGGCRAEDCREVVIRPSTSICGGYMTDSLTAPRTIKFKGFSIHNPGDEVIHYRWTFGDGSTALGREVTHTYNQGGDYEVCLYIKTRLGCETRICKRVRIPGNNQPTLHLTPNPVVNVLNVQFLSTHTEQVTIKILNGFGVPVRTYIRNVNAGPNSWTVELANLLPGVYSFVVQSPNQLASAIFIKQ